MCRQERFLTLSFDFHSSWNYESALARRGKAQGPVARLCRGTATTQTRATLPAAVTESRSEGTSPRAPPGQHLLPLCPTRATHLPLGQPGPAPPGPATSPMQSPMTSSFSVLSAWLRHTRKASASRCTACTAILPSRPPPVFTHHTGSGRGQEPLPPPALGSRANPGGARRPV